MFIQLLKGFNKGFNMVIKIFLLMVLCHIIEDFVLQTVWLSKFKQKETWLKIFGKEELVKNGYENDYLCALIIHSASWSIMIMLPLMFMMDGSTYAILFTFVLNTIFHAITDDLKANKKAINLWTDQTIHIVQIMVTLLIWLT